VRQRDLISGSVLFVLSVILFFQAKQLAFWGEMGPAEGFFPLVLSLVLAGISLLILIQAFLRAVESGDQGRIVGPNRKKLFSYLALFFGFGILFPYLGYSLILAAFLITILRWVENQSWKMTLVITISLVLCSNLLFVQLLKISIPEGVFTSALRLLR
jgi:hypothetical protein